MCNITAGSRNAGNTRKFQCSVNWLTTLVVRQFVRLAAIYHAVCRKETWNHCLVDLHTRLALPHQHLLSSVELSIDARTIWLWHEFHKHYNMHMVHRSSLMPNIANPDSNVTFLWTYTWYLSIKLIHYSKFHVEILIFLFSYFILNW